MFHGPTSIGVMSRNSPYVLAVLLLSSAILLSTIAWTVSQKSAEIGHKDSSDVLFADSHGDFSEVPGARDPFLFEDLSDESRMAPATGDDHPEWTPMDPPPTHEDRVAVLDAVLADILKNPEHKDYLASYGERGTRRVALATDSPGIHVPWPPDYQPNIPEYDIQFVSEQRERKRDDDRLMGIRLEGLDLSKRYSSAVFARPPNVHVTVFNIGGDGGGGIRIIGGTTVSYVAERADNGWKVRFAMSLTL